MEILIKFTGNGSWESKLNGVILVEKESDIEPLWQMLIEQDDYWGYHKEVIQVAPKVIDSIADIARMCVYVGKTDIHNPKELQAKIPFIMYQETPDYDEL